MTLYLPGTFGLDFVFEYHFNGGFMPGHFGNVVNLLKIF